MHRAGRQTATHGRLLLCDQQSSCYPLQRCERVNKCRSDPSGRCSRLVSLWYNRLIIKQTICGRNFNMSSTTATAGARPAEVRWLQLLAGIICMVMIANLQYGWTLFVNPIDEKYHWGRATIQVAFTIFVLTETWLVPIEGYLIDKFGPRVMISGSGVLVAIAWVINSVADSLFLLYLGAAIGGIGAGVIYGGSVGHALKWFPDRRRLGAGVTSAGFGARSARRLIPLPH